MTRRHHPPTRAFNASTVAITLLIGGCGLAAWIETAAGQSFPSTGSPNPAMSASQSASPAMGTAPVPVPQTDATPTPPTRVAPTTMPVAPARVTTPASGALPLGSVPRAVSIARATAIPGCTAYVDGAVSKSGNGTATSPHKTIGAAIAGSPAGAVICVAEGTYSEQLKPREKYFTLAGGFQRGMNFSVRDSARYISKAQGPRSGSFLRIEDPAPQADQLTAIDGFEITGYAQAIVRSANYVQRFDVTNNHIHDNKCGDDMAGAGAALDSVLGRVEGNVFRNNACGRGGALFIQDNEKKTAAMLVAKNLVDSNHGTEPGAAHGGAFYLFGRALTITGNFFTNNSVTQWGAGLYIGAYTEGGDFTTATMSWNVYRGNRAGNGGGGLFCDDGATCISEHDIFDGNCGSNIYLDGGSGGSGPTTARISFMTNVNAFDPGCGSPGAGIRIDKNGGAPDNYSIANSLFWGNAPNRDFVFTCDVSCDRLKAIITHSMSQAEYTNQGKGKITFGPGIVAPADPLFAAPGEGDFHLRSTAGRSTPAGYVQDPVMSPAIAKADPNSPVDKNPARAGTRNELGAYGNSGEASYVR